MDGMDAPWGGDLYDLLQTARPRPGMFVRDWSLEELASICWGYHAALKTHGISEFGSDFNHRFHDWLRRRFGRWDTQGWAHAIREQSPTAEAAWERFFQLLDEFRIEELGDQDTLPNS
jgi:hypothetical protein